MPAPAPEIDLRRGFARAGTSLFWTSAAVVMALWAAEKSEAISLGAFRTPLSLALLFAGFTLSSLARIVGTTLHLVTRSSLANAGASAVSNRIAQLGFLPRLILGLLPGAQLLTVADLVASARDGTFAGSMREFYRMVGVMVGGGMMGIALASAGWRWWHGTPIVQLHTSLVVAGIGALIMAILIAVSGWVADGFAPRTPASSPKQDNQK